MDYDNKLLWGLIIGSGTTVLGWSLNQVGQLLAYRADDKKKLKHVLYHLLELYNVFPRKDYDVVIKKLIVKIKDKVPHEEFTPEIEKSLISALSPIIKQLISEIIVLNLNKLATSYEEAVKSLSTVDPLIAFRLSGKTLVYQELDIIKKRISDLKIEGIDGELDQGVIKVIDTLKPDISPMLLNAVKEDIILISGKISVIMQWKVKRLLTRYNQIDNSHIDMDRDIESALAKLESQFSEILSKPQVELRTDSTGDKQG